MNKVAAFVGATVGGYAGWWLGSQAGIMTVFLVSIVGTAAGVYFGRRVAQHYS